MSLYWAGGPKESRMRVRPFRPDDAGALAALSASCAKGQSDFVLNPLWETEDELFAEFQRNGISPEDHLLVADGDSGGVAGLAGFLRRPGSQVAGLYAPIVARAERGHGLGGELLRAALTQGEKLGIKLVTAGIGVRNHAGYALLAGMGFRPVRQHFLMRLDRKPNAAGPLLRDVKFSVANPEAAAGVLELYEECGFEPRSLDAMLAVLADPHHATVVAYQSGRLVAFVELETHWVRRVWVAYVGVRSDLRDRGVGSALVGFALEREFERGAESALLLISPANRTALRAYEKSGFRRHRLVDVLERGL
ncbi:MAG TPA: GNAT family N-acetyltransferase [Myxococcota bacterium]|nr:GNAT family N-acetyltransferase [Myxococcota bacterium]